MTRNSRHDAAISPALAQILTAQAWRNERLLNGFRIAIWTSVGVITGGAELFANSSVSPGSLLATAWGVTAAVSGATWLRHFYRRWVATLLTTIDITVLALCMHAGHRYLLANDPALVPHQLHASGLVLMALLATSALRFSWTLSLWSVAYGALVYWVVLVYNDAVNVFSYAELVVIALLGLMLIHTARKLDSILRQALERDSLTRFLPSPVVERISRDPAAVDIRGELQEITVLFADLRDFTALAERLPPHTVVKLLNAFFADMAHEITSHGGIVMQYVGDNIYAVFPETGGADHPRRALECALAMLQRQASRNAQTGREALVVGIGLHTGPAIAGSIGSPQLLNYAYVGDTVNTASRIERLTRPLERPLLVSGITLEHAGGVAAWLAEEMPTMSLRGKRDSQTVWSVTGLRPRASNWNQNPDAI